MSRARSELNEFLQTGVDWKNRAIYFGTHIGTETEEHTEVTPASVDVAVRAINTMTKEASTKPINIYMNSKGGDPYSVLYLVDTILASPCQIKFYGGGSIMSAAVYVMAVCDERNIYPNSTIMVHNGWFGDNGKSDDVYISVEENKRLDDIFFDILASNSFMSKSFWRDVKKRDLFLTSQEAVQLGLADHIQKPLKRGNLRKKRSAHLSNIPSTKSVAQIVKKLYNRVSINPKNSEITVRFPNKDENDPEVIIDETAQT